MNPADYRAEDRMFLERVQAYAESPGAFRNRWRLRYFRFRGSSWLAAALLLAPLAWLAPALGGVHALLKVVLGAMALVAVLPLARESEEARRRGVHRHRVRHCRVVELREADSSPLPL